MKLIAGTKFQLKLTILTFWTKFVQKGYLQSKTEKSEHYHWIQHIRISPGTKFQLKLTILMFWNKLPKKRYFQLETEKSHLCMCPWLLLAILNFSAWVQQTQRYFNVSSPSSCGDQNVSGGHFPTEHHGVTN